MANTCDDVRKGAESDGLTWVGAELPTSLPSDGHYVSLHIWPPESNFHWIRTPRNSCAIPAQFSDAFSIIFAGMDANMKWSHKPGGSPVRNHDNDGKEIRACEKTKGCAAFTFIASQEKTAPKSKCWLKKAGYHRGAEHAVGTVSGVVRRE